LTSVHWRSSFRKGFPVGVTRLQTVLHTKIFLHLLITALLAAPAVCCAQLGAAAATPRDSAAEEMSTNCPGHVALDADREDHDISLAPADSCSGCALMQATTNAAAKPVEPDSGFDQAWVVIVGVAVPRAGDRVATHGIGADPRAFSPGFADTPVTRFDRLLLLG